MEYYIRAVNNKPGGPTKDYKVMRFNRNLEVDTAKWKQVNLERENNMREFKGVDEEQPKFGAGSEFGREAKEEARRKKLGIIAKKYKVGDQPWLLKTDGNNGKKFKGIREGGVSDNVEFCMFAHAEDGCIEAFFLEEWYKFQPIQRYKALTAEEAEEEFSRRSKHLNFFSLMMRKRLKGDEEADLEEEEKGKTSNSKSKQFKISEMDEWMNSSDDSSDDGDAGEKDEDDNLKDSKKKGKGKKNQKKKKKTEVSNEAFEDSDDGDGEGRERDYISDSTDSEPENTNLEGVAEEKGLKKLLNSDEEDEDSDKSDKEASNEDDDKDKEGDQSDDKDKKEREKDKKKNKKKTKKDVKKEIRKEENSSDFSSDSSSEDDKKKPVDKKGKKEDLLSGENSSRSGTPTDNKRKIINDALAGPSNKKMKLDLNTIPGSSESGITEETVRKYLMRKPMTTTELLQKFKSKKTGLSSEQIVNIMTQILKKINPVKQMVKGKMYLSIKPT